MSDERAESRWRRRAHLGLTIFSFVLVLGLVALVVAPIFKPLDTFGVHDWDAMEAYRFITVKSLKDYHQIPFWNPYNCGGHTWWAGYESGSNLVSPWLPGYLLLPFALALRVEVAGAAALGAIGTWALAGRFTKSPGARLACAAIFLNSRWGLQTSVGHMWHLYYAWTPWALFFLDRALAMRAPVTSSQRREVILVAVTLAMMVYTGGIYPLPHTVILLGVYALYYAVASRSWRPILILGAAGVLSVAFSAPRLLPLIDMLRRFPRLVLSPESLDLAGLVGVFTSSSPETRPAVGPWGWHEWGIYVGWIPFLAMIAAVFLARRAHERALVLGGAICILVGVGRFSTYSPWGLMHDHIPIFESQHVPSRWLYPGAIVLGVAMAAIVERWLSRVERRTWLEVAYLFLGAYIALDIGLEAQKPMVGSFVRRAPPIADSTGPFRMEKTAPPKLRYDVSDWAPTSMPLMMANIGAKDCATFPGLHSYYWDRNGHMNGIGAKAVGESDYRGETYTVSGTGAADVVSWSPNAVTVSYRGAKIGDTLVLNQNWDPGWRANGSATFNQRDAVGTTINARDGEVTFRYVPRFFYLGCLLCVAAIAVLVWMWRARIRILSTA